VQPEIGDLRVERTAVDRVEAVFQKMDHADHATSTIDHTWSYLNQACEYGMRKGLQVVGGTHGPTWGRRAEW
jgi:hypothetical protein